MDFTAALAEKIRREGYDSQYGVTKGVSPGFLAAVIEANLGEIVDEWVRHARECGELRCPQCEDYWPLDRASVGGDGAAYCPDCGERLEAEVCARCGGPVDEGSGIWKDGLCRCRSCA